MTNEVLTRIGSIIEEYEQMADMDTMEGLRNWAIEHAARTDERWKMQDVFNKHCEKDHVEIRKRMTAVEKKVIWFSGGAAAFGTILATLATKVFS